MAWNYGATGKVDGSSFERGCGGKVPYPSEAGAEAALKYLQKQRAMRTNDGVTVYECAFCKQWHFGH